MRLTSLLISSDNRAISSVNLLKNSIGVQQAGALVIILKEHLTLKSLCGNKGDETKLDMSGKMEGAEDAIMLAAEIIGNGAISSVNLLKNDIPMEQAKVLANVLKEHPTLKSLCGNSGDETELDISGKKIGAEGAVMLAPEIADNGALSVANAMGNKIGKKQLSKLQAIMRSKPNLMSLCGIAGDATEADLSGLGMDADDAVILASELPDKGALSSVNLASNCLYAEGTKLLAEVLTGNTNMTELSISGNAATWDGKEHGEMSGIIALADAIPDMGALTSLNLALNKLNAEGAKIVAEAIKVTNCAIAVVLVPFSCPSDHWLNCCCLLLSTG
jgi:hypothetical protein